MTWPLGWLADLLSLCPDDVAALLQGRYLVAMEGDGKATAVEGALDAAGHPAAMGSMKEKREPRPASTLYDTGHFDPHVWPRLRARGATSSLEGVPVLQFVLYVLELTGRFLVEWRDHVVIDPAVLTGKPIVKGSRLAVEYVVELLAQGWTEDDIMRNYPGVTRDDIRACLAYASEVLHEEKVYPR